MLIVLPFSSFCQLKDDFSDGDLTNNPRWNGDVANFLVEESRLRSNGPEDKSFIYLSAPLNTDNLQEWQLTIDLKFAPSGSNQFRYYLLSDSSNLQHATNGYYLELGQSGDDQFHLKEIKAGVISTILTSRKAYSSEINTAVKVVYRSGEWQLYIKDELDFIYDTAAVGEFLIYPSAFAGISCKYTSTRRDKFYFDIIYAGPIIIDTAPPYLNALEIIDNNDLQLVFNETIDQAQAQDILLNELYHPEIVQVDRNKISLSFNQSFREGENSLFVSNVRDLAGNQMPDTLMSFDYHTISIPETGDILINEFMSDPSPSIELPESEYVELWNVADKHFDLSQLMLNGRAISVEKKLFPAGAYVILCPAAYAIDFMTYGPVQGMASWDILKNSADEIILTENSQNRIIDEIYYSSEWFYGNSKSNGGYSMERISREFPCQQKYNWSFSEHMEGGTPGTANSLAGFMNDRLPPSVRYAIVTDTNSVRVSFSEALSPLSVQVSDFISAEVDFSRIYRNENEQEVYLKPEQLLVKNKIYPLKIKRVADCFGNEMTDTNTSFVLPDSIEAGDILLTEILFDPYATGADFIEIYNDSEKVIDLQDLYISNDSTKFYTVAKGPKMLLPNSYLAITTDTNKVAADYPRHGNLHQVSSMPSMPNAEGNVYLLNEDQLVLEFTSYNEDQHLEILASTEGVSLERISLTDPADNYSNWQSASSTAGFATPGLENSQNFIDGSGQGFITLSSPYFTPNHDGEKDMLVISYNLDAPGMIGSITVYDPFGKKIVQLADNATLSLHGKFFWDGITNEGVLAATGNYIILAEMYTIQGNLIKVKEKIALIH